MTHKGFLKCYLEWDIIMAFAMPYAWYLYGAKIEWSSLFEFAVQLTANYVKKEVLVTQVIRFNFFILTFGFEKWSPIQVFLC